MLTHRLDFKGRRIEIAVRPTAHPGEWEWGYRIDGDEVRQGRPLLGTEQQALDEAVDTACREILLVLHTAPGDLEAS